MSSEINICGVLIHGRPEDSDQLKLRLETIPGTEVHHTTEDGRLIITVEADTQRQAGDRMIDLNKVDGVLSASLVYHHFEADTPQSVHMGE